MYNTNLIDTKPLILVIMLLHYIRVKLLERIIPY